MTSKEEHAHGRKTPELLADLVAAGYPTTERQLERWRSEGLLPKGRQDSSYKGSVFFHAPKTLHQAIALHRAKGKNRRFELVGPTLWAAGYDVAEDHWAERLLAAERLRRRSAPFVQKVAAVIEARLPDKTLGDVVDPTEARSGLAGKIARRLDAPELARAVNLISEISSGTFEHFDHPASERDRDVTETIIVKALDFSKGSEDQVLGQPLRLAHAIGGVLTAISKMQDSNEIQDLQPDLVGQARLDVRNALKIAICLYEGVGWIYGPTAFGLRLCSWFAQRVGLDLFFYLAVTFARLRH